MRHSHSHRGVARPGFVLAVLVLLFLGAVGFRNLDGWLEESASCSVWEQTRGDGDSYTLNYSTESWAAARLGDRVGGEFDKFELLPVTDSLTLTEGVPTTALVNLGVFTVGLTGQPIEYRWRLTRALTINGVTRPLSQPATIATGMNTDFLRLGDGRTLSFEVPLSGGSGIVEVTPLEQDLWGTTGNPTNTEPVHATFLLRDVRSE
jgi:hypothetical protein